MIRKCEFCKEYFDEEEMDLVRVSDDKEGIGSESVWLCRNCEEEMRKIE